MAMNEDTCLHGGGCEDVHIVANMQSGFAGIYVRIVGTNWYWQFST